MTSYHSLDLCVRAYCVCVCVLRSYIVHACAFGQTFALFCSPSVHTGWLTPIQTGDFQHPPRLCCVSLFYQFCFIDSLDKSMLFEHKVLKTCALHEVIPGASLYLCFPPSYSICTPPPQCNSREEGVDSSETGVVTVPPQME